MANRTLSIVVFVAGITLSISGLAAAQGPPQQPPFITGGGTTGTIPVWTGSGETLGDSHIRDTGGVVSVSVPIQAAGASSGPAVSGSGVNGTGVGGFSSNNNGVTGSTSSNGPFAGVAGFGRQYGLLGFGNADGGWGVKGVATSSLFGVGVEGIAAHGAAIRGNMLQGNTPTAGDAGQFVTGAGGNILVGFLSNFNGPGGWDMKFVVDAQGNLTTMGDASKPGGGSWSTLSDARTKKSIEPIGDALGRLLKLRGVNYEYTNPSAFHERAGQHVGMVAQDVEQVFPSWVDTGKDGYKRLTFRGFEAVAVEAVRELNAQMTANAKEAAARIEDLKRENVELRHAIEVLSERINALQQK